MAVPVNAFQQVQTYQRSGLALLQNLFCGISTANKKFKDFQNFTGNLGSTVTYTKPPKASTVNSLVASFEGIEQRVGTLTVDQPISSAFAVTNEQFLFNAQQYIDDFGGAAIAEIGSQIESNILLNAETKTYRFYGNGSSAINSFGQLVDMVQRYKSIGSTSKGPLKCYLPNTAVPAIVNSGLNQFVLKRNDDIAMSWELGTWGGVTYYESNLLPLHVAGTCGDSSQTLTVISTNDPTGANITQITVSGATINDADAIKAYDKLEFVDGVSGFSNLRFLTQYGHKVSSAPVQIRATANAAADGSGHVVINISPALQATSGKNQNINTNILAGMQLTVAKSHRVGLLVDNDALFLAMPRLPDQSPFMTSNEADPDSGASIRLTYGATFGANQLGWIHDAIWGSQLEGEYAMAMCFPATV